VEKKKGKTSGKKRRERLQGKKEGNVLYYVKSEFMIEQYSGQSYKIII